jgi:hypothetical protein
MNRPGTNEDTTNLSKFVPKNGRVALNKYAFCTLKRHFSEVIGGIAVDKPF